mgnify:CR=1 FL=1|tara:strand:+ start:1412 stop:1828 length:417 start_codon:yes stop_codon:yes gene_type:complete
MALINQWMPSHGDEWECPQNGDTILILSERDALSFVTGEKKLLFTKYKKALSGKKIFVACKSDKLSALSGLIVGSIRLFTQRLISKDEFPKLKYMHGLNSTPTTLNGIFFESPIKAPEFCTRISSGCGKWRTYKSNTS